MQKQLRRIVLFTLASFIILFAATPYFKFFTGPVNFISWVLIMILTMFSNLLLVFIISSMASGKGQKKKFLISLLVSLVVMIIMITLTYLSLWMRQTLPFVLLVLQGKGTLMFTFVPIGGLAYLLGLQEIKLARLSTPRLRTPQISQQRTLIGRFFDWIFMVFGAFILTNWLYFVLAPWIHVTREYWILEGLLWQTLKVLLWPIFGVPLGALAIFVGLLLLPFVPSLREKLMGRKQEQKIV